MRLWDQGTLMEDGQASRIDTILDRVLAVPEGGTLKLEVTRPPAAIDVNAR
jgi:Ribonuclease G/E